VKRRDHSTMVRPFPISVGSSNGVSADGEQTDATAEHAAIVNSLGIEATILGIGVDRVDYTKGILERFQSVERFLENNPRYQGRFTFVQIGAPSRTHIKRYLDLQFELESEAVRINARFQGGKWRPIVFLNRQHSHEEIQHYYRAADLCLVTSLHDGMNLVAKEYVAARQDERGALILSQFTGAARELVDALIVNPYDIDETAAAIRCALEMDVKECTARMHRMRKVVKEHNVYWWASGLITELCDVRLDRAGQLHARVPDDASVA
jgi:trehalose 6-phosphate synthase